MAGGDEGGAGGGGGGGGGGVAEGYLPPPSSPCELQAPPFKIHPHSSSGIQVLGFGRTPKRGCATSTPSNVRTLPFNERIPGKTVSGGNCH